MNQLPSSVAVMQIRPDAIIEYLEYFGPWRGACHRQITEEDRKEAYNGLVSDPTAKRIKKAVNLLLQISPRRIIYNPVTQKEQQFQIAFLTLTVSSKSLILTAEDAYDRLLKHFLQWLRRTKKVTSYIWKAELQRRGQIHYHLTFGNFINHSEIRQKWNELQRREGLLEEYYEEKGHYNPNSIDIHSVYNIKNLAGYLVKYIAKGQERDPVMLIDNANAQKHTNEEIAGSILSCYPATTIAKVRTLGKVWDCSTNLKKGKYFNEIMTATHDWTLKKAAEEKVIKTIEGGNYKIHCMRGNNPLELLSETERHKYNDHIEAIKRPIIDEII